MSLYTPVKKTPLLIIAGPTASGKSDTAVELAIRMMSDYYLDAAVIGCHSLDLINGIYEGSEAVVQYKNTLINHSRKVILLADHTKFDHTSLIRTAPFSMIHTLITDREPSEEWMRHMEEENVQVLFPPSS